MLMLVARSGRNEKRLSPSAVQDLKLRGGGGGGRRVATRAPQTATRTCRSQAVTLFISDTVACLDRTG